MKLSRLWIRQLVKVILALAALSLLVVFTDSYFDFLPTSVHTKLPLHQPGSVITDIKIVTCITKSGCASEVKNGWQQLGNDFYFDKKWTKQAFVFVKRMEEDDLKDSDLVVEDVALDATEVDDEKGWERAGSLWIKYGPLTKKSVTSVQILFGKDAVDPRPGWKLKSGIIDKIITEPRITVLKGRRQEIPNPKLKVPKNEKYKILQVADLHFSTGVGKCIDPLPEYAAGCEADPRTLDFYKRLLDHERPDFVALTGDQIYGQESPDSISALLKVVAPLIERKIPYAMIFGNHDDEGSLGRAELMQFAETLPYCLSTAGPEDIAGIGNFVLQVEGPKSDNPAMTFYFLDTHKRLPNQKKTPGYDHIKQDQIDWVKNQYLQLKPLQDKYSHIHLSMGFLHIPLPEYVRPGNKFIGGFKEGSTAPRFNSNARDAFVEVGVTSVFAGHDHVNDFCMYDDHTEENKGQIWLCHGGAIGEGGYGGYDGFVRRSRVIEVDTQSASVRTWKIKNQGEYQPFDEQTLIQGGQVQPI